MFRDHHHSGSLGTKPILCCRFTVYNFKQMRRRSYYPNTHIISTMTVTSSTGVGHSRPTTPVTPSGENPPLPDNYEMREKEPPLPPPQDETYDPELSHAL